MAFTRIKRTLNNNEVDNVTSSKSLSSLKDYAPTPFTAPRPYYFVSKLPDMSTVASNTSFYTNKKMYALMEGNKRLMTWGYSDGGYILNGGNYAQNFYPYPTLAQYDTPLEKDDYISQFVIGKGNAAAFVTEKGYLYTGGYNDDDGWLGFGGNDNRYAFSRVLISNTVTTSAFSSGGAPGATTFVIGAANASIQIGQYIIGIGITSGTTVTGISGTTLTLSNPFHTQAAGTYGFATRDNVWGPGGVKAKKVYFGTSVNNTSSEQWVVVLSDTGDVYTCGYNGHGQLGDGTTNNRKFFNRITTISNVKEIFVNNYTIMAITQSNQLYGWGYNGYGTMGLNNTTGQTTPVLLANDVDRVFLKTHDYDTAFYISRNGGQVFAAGSNYFGSLGINVSGTTNTTVWTPINTTNIGTRRIIDIKATGTGTYNSTWFLCDDGTVFACGNNATYGQLGDGTLTDRAIPVQLIQPAGFPKVDKIFVAGGSNGHFITGVNSATGRMWSVGCLNYGAIGQALGEPTATWAMTGTNARAQYPAREVTAPPPIEDGYAKFKDMFIISNAGVETTVFCLLDDGTLWSRGEGYLGPRGNKLSLGYGNAEYFLVGNQRYDTSWKQVEF